MIETVPKPTTGAKQTGGWARAVVAAIVGTDRMHESRTLGRRTGSSGPGLGALLLVGCFVGDAADGLPCENDADCGIGVACLEDPATATSCCGGNCLTGGASTGLVTTTTEASTTEASSSSTGSSSGESSSTTGEPCGNGVLDPDEECDPGLTPPCSADCRLCGNGALDEGELCDPGIDGQEGCDGCSELTLLSWDSQSPPAQAEADFEFPVWEGPMDPLVWRRASNTGALVSGPYMDPVSNPTPGTLDPDGGWPQSRLLSRRMTFPDLEATDVVEVRIDHAFAFASDETRFYDHGRVDFVTDVDATSDTWLPLLPDGDDGTAVTCSSPPPDSTCFLATPGQPFCDGGEDQWLAGQADSTTAVLDVLPADVAGRTLLLSFRLRYDCRNPAGNPGMDDAWSVAAVSVVVSRRSR